MFSGAAFVLWLALPLLAWWLRKRISVARGNRWVLYAGTVIAGSLLYVGAVWVVGKELEHALYKFDSDGDRSFSDSEMTPEAEEAMRRFTTDTGRTFAPIVALPVTLVWVSLWFLLLAAGTWGARELRGGSNKNEVRQVNDGNGG